MTYISGMCNCYAVAIKPHICYYKTLKSCQPTVINKKTVSTLLYDTSAQDCSE